jgi:glycosyltransferase involved in cell wall biosynthesis
LKIPLAVTYHGSEPERIAGFGKIAGKCDLVITPSHRSAEDLASIGGVPRDKLKVIGLGVNPAPDDPEDEIAALRHDLLGDGERLIITVARLEYQKGIDILIDCVARLKTTHPGYRFVVAGDGVDEEKYKDLAREKGVGDHLRFLGRVNRPHLYLRASDLFLLTSRWEALPFTIVEAFQAGVPTVATACSGVVELIDGAVGAVAPIGDVPAICAAVTDILDDEPQRLAMAAAALARSREDRFDPAWVHAQFEQTYLELAEKRRTT